MLQHYSVIQQIISIQSSYCQVQTDSMFSYEKLRLLGLYADDI